MCDPVTVADRRYSAPIWLRIDGTIDDIDLRLLASCRRTPGCRWPSWAAASGCRRPRWPSASRGCERDGRDHRLPRRRSTRARSASRSAAIIRIRPAPRRDPEGRRARPRTPEVVECHRMTGEDCFFMKRPRARRGAPRGGDRPLRVLRPDDDVDHAVVARAAARGQPFTYLRSSSSGAARPRGAGSASSPRAGRHPTGPGPSSTTRVSVRPPPSATSRSGPGGGVRRATQRILFERSCRGGAVSGSPNRIAASFPPRPTTCAIRGSRIARSPCAPTPAAPRGRPRGRMPAARAAPSRA